MILCPYTYYPYQKMISQIFALAVDERFHPGDSNE